jgi:hypothetical protein
MDISKAAYTPESTHESYRSHGATVISGDCYLLLRLALAGSAWIASRTYLALFLGQWTLFECNAGGIGAQPLMAWYLEEHRKPFRQPLKPRTKATIASAIPLAAADNTWMGRQRANQSGARPD